MWSLLKKGRPALLGHVVILSCMASPSGAQEKYPERNQYAEGRTRFRSSDVTRELSDTQRIEMQKAEFYNTKTQDPLQGATGSSTATARSGIVRGSTIGRVGSVSNRQGLQLSGTAKACAPGEAFIRRPGRFKTTNAVVQDQMGYCLAVRCGASDRRVNAVTGDRECIARAPAANPGNANTSQPGSIDPMTGEVIGGPVVAAATPTSGGSPWRPQICEQNDAACISGFSSTISLSDYKGKGGAEKGDLSSEEVSMLQDKLSGAPQADQQKYLEEYFGSRGYTSDEASALAEKRMVTLGFSSGKRSSAPPAASGASSGGSTSGSGSSTPVPPSTGSGSVAQSSPATEDGTEKSEDREPASQGGTTPVESEK